MRRLPTDPDMEGHRQTDSSRFVYMLPLMEASLLTTAPPAFTGPCTAGVVNQLDGLYRWRVQSQQGRIDQIKSLTTQRQRFTPSLFELLLQAKKLRPTTHGRFLSFDVFSDTQVRTFGATVIGCSAQKARSIQAEVRVDVGLRDKPSGIPRGLLYEMNRGSKGSWVIDNITYLDDGRVSLRPYLKNLLNPAS